MNRRRDDWVAQERRRRNAPPDPPPVKPCWVHGDHGRTPGLLLEWRRTPAGWQGRVVHPVRDGAGWAVVDEWITAEQLEPDR